MQYDLNDTPPYLNINLDIQMSRMRSIESNSMQWYNLYDR